MNWTFVLSAIVWLVKQIAKDTDGDGRADWQDSDPKNPDVQ